MVNKPSTASKSEVEAPKTAANSSAENSKQSLHPHMPAHAHAFDKHTIQWEAPEYIPHQRGKLWYILASAIAILLALYSIWTHSWTMLAAILLVVGAYIFTHSHQPKHIQIAISEMGVKVGQKTFPYSHIKAFWIIHQPPFINTLNIRTTERMFQDVTVQLSHQDPVPIKKFLARHIPEWEGKEENMHDILARVFKL